MPIAIQQQGRINSSWGTGSTQTEAVLRAFWRSTCWLWLGSLSVHPRTPICPLTHNPIFIND